MILDWVVHDCRRTNFARPACAPRSSGYYDGEEDDMRPRALKPLFWDKVSTDYSNPLPLFTPKITGSEKRNIFKKCSETSKNIFLLSEDEATF